MAGVKLKPPKRLEGCDIALPLPCVVVVVELTADDVIEGVVFGVPKRGFPDPKTDPDEPKAPNALWEGGGVGFATEVERPNNEGVNVADDEAFTSTTKTEQLLINILCW